MTRLPKFMPDQLDDAQRALYDTIAGGRRAQGPQLFSLCDEAGALEGPFNAFLAQPALGMALQSVGTIVRYETSFSDRVREIAILIVADHCASNFEWYAHEAIGRHVGLTEAEVAGLREKRYDALPLSERPIAATTLALVRDGDLGDDAYAVAIAALGQAGLFELTTLVGYYALLAMQMRVNRVQAPTS